MSWDPKDSAKHRNTSAPSAPPSPATPEPLGPALPGIAEALPTIAAARAWEERSEEAGPRVSREERRLMASMGLWPADDWQAWKQIATRGIVAL